LKSTKVVVMKERKFGPSDFQEEIQCLQKEGRMPSLQAVLQAVGEIREVYRPLILVARQRTGK
jgi:hypothetical protein